MLIPILCIADNVNSFGKPVSIQVRDVFNWAFQLGEKPITVARQAGTDGYQFSLPHVNRLRHFRHGRRLAAYVAHLTRGGDPDATFLRQLRRARLQMMEFSPTVLAAGPPRRPRCVPALVRAPVSRSSTGNNATRGVWGGSSANCCCCYGVIFTRTLLLRHTVTRLPG